ncbi:hypothetical protein UFOVP116_134 [uncultured Caudovirales phage]|uniref:Uncharacterized protein n=1 Tax=uncultured Caudovirales phage TaxID=2100421 RepID=A0A6J5LDW9_9CAUD|nr:hypothetical protein UFOVP116_134 [uncultured Caudovirales phage]
MSVKQTENQAAFSIVEISDRQWHATDKFTQSTRWYMSDPTTGESLLHRDDGPAIEYNDGKQLYYCKGALHRSDGPACIYTCGGVSWWLYGKPYFSASEFCEAAQITGVDKTMLLLKWGN